MPSSLKRRTQGWMGRQIRSDSKLLGQSLTLFLQACLPQNLARQPKVSVNRFQALRIIMTDLIDPVADLARHHHAIGWRHEQLFERVGRGAGS